MRTVLLPLGANPTAINKYIKYINYKHSANTKGIIHGNTLPRGMQVKKGWEPLHRIRGWLSA